MKTMTQKQYKDALEGVSEVISKLTDLADVIPANLGLDTQIDQAFSAMMGVFSEIRAMKPVEEGIKNA